jgi:hypothetical protein
MRKSLDPGVRRGDGAFFNKLLKVPPGPQARSPATSGGGPASFCRVKLKIFLKQLVT